MPDITDSVGEGGPNKVHDVAMVQAMLSVIKDAKNHAYLGDYDGKYGNTTKAAIIKFQTDQGLINPGAKPGAGAPGAAAAEKEGLVAKNSDTLAKMVAAVPADYTEIRIIENASTVYFPGTQADCKASTAAINGTQDLEPGFRGKIALLVGKMFETHKIVLWLTGSGGHRSFEEQFQIFVKNKTTKAGPGESNHNFGRAVDIGFNQLQWLKGGGTIVTDDWWLNKLTNNEKDKVGKAKAEEFWKARDAIAIPLGLWNSILDGDDDHLQSFDDHLPNDKSLVDLMNRVGALKWEAEHNTPRRYLCDLGLGGKKYNVGKATEIWSLTATVTKANIAEAKTEALKAAALAKGGAAAVKAVVPVKESDIKDEDVKKMRQSLKDDFLAAEKEWLKWRPVLN